MKTSDQQRSRVADEFLVRTPKGSAGQNDRSPAQAFILGWPYANLGGVNEVVRNLVREFSSSGKVAPIVIEAMDGKPQGDVEGGTPVYRLAFPLIYDARSPRTALRALLGFCFRMPRLFRQLRLLCRKHNVQVLNPHFVSLEHLSLLIFRWFGFFSGQIILSFHGSDIRTMIQSRGIERFLARVLLRGADLLIPCSRGLGQEMLLLVPECVDRIVPIQNGIDVARFLASVGDKATLPPSFEKRRRILNIGAFEYKKGHDILLQAFAEVHRERVDTCLIIVGQARDKIGATRRLVTALGLDEDVLLLQDLAHGEVAALLQAADLFVLSSRWEKGICGEGFAMALLEAAAAQKPVVSTLSCGVEELIENGETGTVVAAENPGELAQALLLTLDNPEEADRQGRNLHNKVLHHFTWKRAYRQYLDLMSLS